MELNYNKKSKFINSLIFIISIFAFFENSYGIRDIDAKNFKYRITDEAIGKCIRDHTTSPDRIDKTIRDRVADMVFSIRETKKPHFKKSVLIFDQGLAIKDHLLELSNNLRVSNAKMIPEGFGSKPYVNFKKVKKLFCLTFIQISTDGSFDETGDSFIYYFITEKTLNFDKKNTKPLKFDIEFNSIHKPVISHIFPILDKLENHIFERKKYRVELKKVLNSNTPRYNIIKMEEVEENEENEEELDEYYEYEEDF